MARTEIKYDDYKVKAFLDTNIILEGRPLPDLPWEEIDADGPIIVLLTPTAIKEVDAHKQDRRVGERARAFNRLIAPVAAGGAPIVICESKPRVELALARAVRIPWDQYDDLDPADGDYGFHSQQYALHTSLNIAIDKLAEQITGDPRFFVSPGHSTGGSPEAMSPRQERELRWRDLRLKYQ